MFTQVPDGWCATTEIDNNDTEGVYSYSTDPSLVSSFEPIVYNIFFWGINKSDGTPGISKLNEQECLSSVAQLNRVYNDFNIFFKYTGYDNTSFNSDEYYHLTGGEVSILNQYSLFDFAADNGFKKNYSFNVYVASGGADFGGVAQNLNKTNIATHHNFANNYEEMIVHEVGHCFNLRHTHSNWEDTSTCEHVTRNEGDPNYNVDVAGDKVTDTPALPDFYYEHLYELLWNGVPFPIAIEQFIPYNYVDPITFDYTNLNGDDCQSTLYQISSIDVKNYMSYNPESPNAYFNVFSDGQIIRMREAIIDDVFGEFANAETSIETLYKPYKGEYFLAGPLPVDDDGNLNPPLFQPGFKYNFVECSGDFSQPADFNETFSYNINTILLDIDKDETDYRSITHPNHSAIYIVHHDLVPNPYPKNAIIILIKLLVVVYS
jgi:hypothetical protein